MRCLNFWKQDNESHRINILMLEYRGAVIKWCSSTMYMQICPYILCLLRDPSRLQGCYRDGRHYCLFLIPYNFRTSHYCLLGFLNFHLTILYVNTFSTNVIRFLEFSESMGTIQRNFTFSTIFIDEFSLNPFESLRNT